MRVPHASIYKRQHVIIPSVLQHFSNERQNNAAGTSSGKLTIQIIIVVYTTMESINRAGYAIRENINDR